MSGYTVRRYEQSVTFPETIEQELQPAVCEHRQTDIFKENYSIDDGDRYTMLEEHFKMDETMRLYS